MNTVLRAAWVSLCALGLFLSSPAGAQMSGSPLGSMGTGWVFNKSASSDKSFTCLNGAKAPDWQKVVSECTRVLSLVNSERRPDVLLRRAQGYEGLGQYPDAIGDLDAALNMRPNDTAILNERCWSRAASGQQLELAWADCDASLQQDSYRNSGAYDARALVHYRKSEYQLAISDEDQAIKANSRDAEGFYLRGMTKVRMGDATGGNTDLEMAKSIYDHVADKYIAAGLTP